MSNKVKEKKTIGIDFDDVLMDFHTALHSYHNAHYGTTVSRSEIGTFWFHDAWGCSLEESVERIFIFYDSLDHKDAHPVLGVKSGIERLSKDYDLHVITARPDTFKKQTVEWLREHIPYLSDKIHFTGAFGGSKKRTKSEVCSELGIDFFIEDALHNMEELAPHLEKVLLFDTPWNQTQDGELPSNVTRVFSWEDITSRL